MVVVVVVVTTHVAKQSPLSFLPPNKPLSGNIGKNCIVFWGGQMVEKANIKGPALHEYVSSNWNDMTGADAEAGMV